MDERDTLKEIARLETKAPDQLPTYEWLARMEQLVIKLDRDPEIELLSYEVHPSLPLVVEQTMGDAAGFEIPIELLSFYRVTDGFDLSWRTKNGEFGGDIHMFGFAEVFGNWIDRLWGVTKEKAPLEDVDFSWELRGVDSANPGDDCWTVLHGPENAARLNLYLHEPKQASHFLELSFTDYLEALLLTRGTHGWQYLFTDEVMSAGSEEETKALNCARALRVLFPNDDFSVLELDDVFARARGEEE